MGIPTLRQGDSVFISDKDKANLLNKQFESVFTRDNGFRPPLSVTTFIQALVRLSLMKLASGNS